MNFRKRNSENENTSVYVKNNAKKMCVPAWDAVCTMHAVRNLLRKT